MYVSVLVQKSLPRPFSFRFDLLWEMDSSDPPGWFHIPELKQSSCFSLLGAKAKGIHHHALLN